MALNRDERPVQERRETQEGRRWPSKKAKPYGLRCTYNFPWARMAWVSTSWYPSVNARDTALRDLHRPGRFKSMPEKIEIVER